MKTIWNIKKFKFKTNFNIRTEKESLPSNNTILANHSDMSGCPSQNYSTKINDHQKYLKIRTNLKCYFNSELLMQCSTKHVLGKQVPSFSTMVTANMEAPGSVFQVMVAGTKFSMVLSPISIII
ncbi:hypothetical protein E2C01_045714 [Portunus trituberculatus]|uniref:Uncharacterized protein n=1 Tax=Portunus trituberculatus TaxID=210409 RepID=A0A5B7FVV9_PORTR|nr:hypothetical protein [Portunus trituberculatus]